MKSKIGRKKAPEIVFPVCTDTRECRFRDKGKCVLLKSVYEKDGMCPWCKGRAEEKTTKSVKKPIGAAAIVNGKIKFKAQRNTEKKCEYYLGKDRMCKATSNTTCKGCTFYSPNHSERTEAIAQYLLECEEDRQKLTSKNKKLESKNKKLERMTRNYGEIIAYARIGKSVVRYKKRAKTN